MDVFVALQTPGIWGHLGCLMCVRERTTMLEGLQDDHSPRGKGRGHKPRQPRLSRIAAIGGDQRRLHPVVIAGLVREINERLAFEEQHGPVRVIFHKEDNKK